MIITFPNDWRKLRKLITWLLKAKLATEIKRLNYLQSYTLINDKIEKKEEKLFLIQTDPHHPNQPDQLNKILAFLQKSFPEAKPLSF